jgi:hypothetical protein
MIIPTLRLLLRLCLQRSVGVYCTGIASHCAVALHVSCCYVLCTVTLLQITDTGGKDVMQITTATLQKLLAALNECTEWGQASHLYTTKLNFTELNLIDCNIYCNAICVETRPMKPSRALRCTCYRNAARVGTRPSKSSFALCCTFHISVQCIP